MSGALELERGGPLARRLGLWLGLASFALLLAAPLPGLDARQRAVAAVTALCAVWWLTQAVPIAATSLLPAALFPLLGVSPAGQIAGSYMHDLVLLFLGAFVIALGLERWEVHRRMALWIIARVGTRPRRLVLGFMVASAFLSMWISNTATTLLMLPIALAVVKCVDCGEEHHARGFTLCLLLGIAYASSMGGTATPVGTAPNQAFLGVFATKYPDAPRIGFADWMVGFLPLVLLFVPLAWLLMTRVLLPVPHSSASGDETLRAERAALGPMGRGARLMSLVFATTALLWVTRADLDLGVVQVPGWSRLLVPAGADHAAHAKDVSDATVAIFMGVACFLIPVKPREGVWLMDWATAVRLPWDVLLLLGGGFAIAKGFGVSGLDAVLGARLAPLLEGQPTWLVVGAVALFMSFLTELTSNTATTFVLLPVAADAAAQGGLDPRVLMLPTTLAASAAFMLPVATPPNAVVFGSRLVPPGVMARTGFVLNMLTVALLTAIFVLWTSRWLGIEAGAPDWAAP
ncbi:MAG: SLC13/DASS family transporter [Planctomycetes bacterium]|nr:SLC13/DASS family transporter [Planctomycetota bacterium]